VSIVELLGEANRQKQKGEWDEAIAVYHQPIQNNPKFHWSHDHFANIEEIIKK